MAAIPFGGRYRLLDFALSCMVNSGLRTVGMIMPYLYRPILDHLGAGKEWYLDRKSGGMFVLPGLTHGIYSRNKKFLLKDLKNNIEFLLRDDAELVIISGCSHIFNVDLNPILASHEEYQADITMVYKELTIEPEDQGVILKTDLHNKVFGLEGVQEQSLQRVKYFAEIFIIGKKLLLEIIRGHENTEYMDLLDVVEENIKVLHVQAYPITSYFGQIYSIQSYYQRNMDMLKPAVRGELFMKGNKIHTKIKDNPPTKYSPQASIRESLVSSGCLIRGNVSNSIIFRGVEIEPGADVSNSIIMQRCVIGKGASLENVILDKNVQVNPRAVVKGKDNHPVFLNKYTRV
jgi:glucose-1-phosphate adenylyltransferase